MSIFRKSVSIISADVEPDYTYGSVRIGTNYAPLEYQNSQTPYGTLLVFYSGGDDLSGIIFTIIGSFEGFNIQEQINGPTIDAANGISSNYFYDKITSITASANLNSDFIVTKGNQSIVTFDNYNLTSVNNYNYQNINSVIKANGATTPLVAGNYAFCGILGQRPNIIAPSYLIPDGNYPPNQFVTYINDITEDITVDQLNNGFYPGTTYPYSSIIIYLSWLQDVIIGQPIYLEIIQS